MTRIFLVLVAAFAFVLNSHSQDYADQIRKDTRKAAGNLFPYEIEPGQDTPAPKGYKPFYISHYGRHGSRYYDDQEVVDEVNSKITALAGLDIFTDAGKAYYSELRQVLDEHEGMTGFLTSLGAREQKGIAARTASRFPEVFSGKEGRRTVRNVSSKVPRCMLSMTNFAHSLERSTTGLEFTFDAGEKYQRYIAYKPEGLHPRHWASHLDDSLRRARMNPEATFSHFFTDVQKVKEVVGDIYSFERDLYLFSCSGHLTDCGHDLLSHFPTDILIANYRMRNPRFYLAYGMTGRYSDYIRAVAAPLVRDFVARADEALSEGSSVAADFRFGHDTAMLPFMCCVGVEGMDKELDLDTVNALWQSFQMMHMASNLQMVFYSDWKGDVLVKLLYNEKETRIPALKPLSGPYYRWSDLRQYLLGRIS